MMNLVINLAIDAAFPVVRFSSENEHVLTVVWVLRSMALIRTTQLLLMLATDALVVKGRPVPDVTVSKLGNRHPQLKLCRCWSRRVKASFTGTCVGCRFLCSVLHVTHVVALVLQVRQFASQSSQPNAEFINYSL